MMFSWKLSDERAHDIFRSICMEFEKIITITQKVVGVFWDSLTLMFFVGLRLADWYWLSLLVSIGFSDAGLY